MSESTESKRYQSPLEGYPEYVKAIGMISIENASLELVLGELLGTLLGVHPHIGHTLYFTPRAAIARLELIENILPLSIATHEQLINELKRLSNEQGPRLESGMKSFTRFGLRTS